MSVCLSGVLASCDCVSDCIWLRMHVYSPFLLCTAPYMFTRRCLDGTCKATCTDYACVSPNHACSDGTCAKSCAINWNGCPTNLPYMVNSFVHLYLRLLLPSSLLICPFSVRMVFAKTTHPTVHVEISLRYVNLHLYNIQICFFIFISNFYPHPLNA